MGIENFDKEETEKLAAGVPSEEIERQKKSGSRQAESEEEMKRKKELADAFDKNLAAEGDLRHEYGKRTAMRRNAKKGNNL